MQRYKRWMMDTYYDGVELDNLPRFSQLPIQSSVYGKYIGFHTPKRAYYVTLLWYIRMHAIKGQYHSARLKLFDAKYYYYTELKRLP